MHGMIDQPLTLVFDPEDSELMRRVLTLVLADLETMVGTDDDDARLDQFVAAYAQQRIIDRLLRKFMHPAEEARLEANKNTRREEALKNARNAAGISDLA